VLSEALLSARRSDPHMATVWGNLIHSHALLRYFPSSNPLHCLFNHGRALLLLLWLLYVHNRNLLPRSVSSALAISQCIATIRLTCRLAWVALDAIVHDARSRGDVTIRSSTSMSHKTGTLPSVVGTGNTAI